MAKNSPWPRITAVATILTPLLLGIGGLLLTSSQQDISERLSEIQQTVSAVEVMQPYIHLIADGTPEKAKMAAYALYKLNPNDKKGAVYIILAANRPESNDVLAVLARDDPEIDAILTQEIRDSEAANRPNTKPDVSDPDEVSVAQHSEITTAAVAVARASSQSGWMYLGTFKDGRWRSKQLEITEQLPQKGQTYKIIDDTYLRVAKPRFPTYKLEDALGVVKAGDLVLIEELDKDLGKNRVWAKIRRTVTTGE